MNPKEVRQEELYEQFQEWLNTCPIKITNYEDNTTEFAVDFEIVDEDLEDLVAYAQEQLRSYLDNLSYHELKEEINNNDEELFDELVDNVTSDSKELIYTDEQKRLTTLEELGG